MAKASGAMMAKMIMSRCIVMVGESSVCGEFGDTNEMSLYLRK